MKLETLPPLSHDYADEERIQRQIKIWQNDQSIRLIAEAMPTGVLVLNEYRQAVFSNKLFLQIAGLTTMDELLGKRPGVILGCANADLEEKGCGSSLFCKNCGALRAIATSLHGSVGIEDCFLTRKSGLSALELRVKTTPIDKNGEKFTIFAIEDISMEKERDALMDKLKVMSETDELTGLYNRRFLYNEAKREIARAIRYQHPITCFMMDIDHFKTVNDTYGHIVGDNVLVKFAEVLVDSMREVDLIVRWGGEEFVALLPESNIEQAHIVSQRLLENVRNIRVPTEQGDATITISIGTTGLYGGRETTFDELIKEADEALYLAKQGGRDRVVHWAYRPQ